MARDYGRVRTQFWESDTMRALAPEVKFVGLYLLTSPHTNAIGCFRLPGAYVAHDTGMIDADLQSAFAALRGAGFMAWCERLPWVYLPNYLKHNPPENPNVWRRCFSEMKLLPVELSARAKIAEELCAIAAEERMRTLSTEEKARVEPYCNRIETVSKGIPPYPGPCPKPDPIQTNNTLPADAGGVPIPKPKVQKTTEYPQEFEQFWKAYDPPKNATKPDALKSWQRSADVRPPLAELLACVAAYRSWIAAESRKRKDPYPIKHPATWLNKRGWESFLASARSVPDPAVQDRADQLMRRGKYADDFKDVA